MRPVTPEFFELLGIRPEAGRLLGPATRRRRTAPPALLSYRVWERVFDGALTRSARRSGSSNQPYTIVGVLPRAFWFSDWGSPVWTLLDPRTRAAPTRGSR